MVVPRLRLGQLLVDARLIAQEALDQVLELQRSDGRRLGTLLVERGLIDETQLTQILSHQLSVPWVSLLHIEFSRQLLNLVPRDVAERYGVVPIYVRHVRGQGDTLYIAMDDPSNEEVLEACASYSGLSVRAMIAPPSDIRSAIRAYYGGGTPAQVVTKHEPTPVATGQEAAPTTRHVAPQASSSASTELDAGPTIETVELALPLSRPRSPRPAEEGPPASERQVAHIPSPKGRAPRMVSLTLLDGTTLTLPPREADASSTSATAHAERRTQELTARDLVAALRAASEGADASEILGQAPRWEPIVAALLSLLLKKHLVADWEFVEEYTRYKA